MSKLKFLLAVAMVAMLVTSCSKEQTSLNFEDIPGKTKVMGQVFYQTGTDYNAATSLTNSKYAVAANKKIFVEVNNSEFRGDAQGISIFETTTDANGEYEIELPIPSKTSMSVIVRAETFTGEMKMFVEMTGTTYIPVYRTDYVTYEIETPVTVMATTATVKDITYDFEPRNLHN